MSSGHVVIVGAGQGGLQAAMSLRQEGHEGPITLVGGEPGLPYQRPPLSKAYLKTGEAEKLALRPESFFETKAITLRPGTWVDAIDRAAQQLRIGSETLDYDTLILATGTRNLRPPIPGVERALDLRTLEDARTLRAALDQPRRIAVIGGGFIGLEFAAVAAGLGHHVSIAEAAPRLMARAVSPAMSERFRALHEGLGTELHLGNGVTEVTERGLLLADSVEVHADLVLLAAGVRPNVELAQQAGLEVDNGVVVDAMLRTADPQIFALGDCAAFPEAVSGRRVRLESVQAATDHARSIAKTIVKGDVAPYAAVPWFWSDQHDFKLQIAGLAAPSDESVALDDGAVLRFRGDRLTAVETINNAKIHMKARRLLGGDAVPARDTLLQRNYDLTAA
ncbi:NAD(P)/FAD-dependent oxidoreductase [Alloyangia pacifica]|uniref:3-phenylpropionate/trans-cinnamate dioxygenase ferredoxin reductase subunit n=1 Tax=Alloyangia pacifica TaxID=311180 RepID=A0A1I6VFV5_9RHOB|nr:FAD-dependent oxidoreductase [Alloyangia pacifica]SDH95930.1 3-phenylpropionate/trans-cinnamate dioxygenase ferredoxin reductase subunit [Alloyangia pacifica]SFT12569.1 3-phenylpropionate/trans-cinnamate dioxygenase ferredoxin reductase subunit [Alloyangia pacifica]